MSDPAGDAVTPAHDAAVHDAAASFEPHRRFLVGLAYRMLGSIAEAEDVAQDAFLRWSSADRGSVEQPRAFLARIASRLCLDRMKAASARRERYVGTWLPEPVIDPMVERVHGATGADRSPQATTALAEDVSYALLMTLERLSPLERAAFLLHDVFDMDYREIADTLDRSEEACRQLAARGRSRVRDERPRFHATPEARARLAGAFHAALLAGDLAALTRLLADDAVLYSDGGGKRNAAINPIYGRDKILRFLVGIASKGWWPADLRIEPAQVNGGPGFVMRSSEGLETIALDVSDDRIVAFYGVRNPDKLRHIT
jgi:RNA polymerase sigma-70 factor, ECF subfamily